MTTPRQQHWQQAAEEEAERGNGMTHALFTMLAQPNAQERGGHSCREHTGGFRDREGRRGFRCQICHAVIKMLDGEGT